MKLFKNNLSKAFEMLIFTIASLFFLTVSSCFDETRSKNASL